MDLLNIAKRVRNGVKLLDKKIPNWRSIVKNHESEFDFTDGACCVLGTLEHYSGRLKVLKKRAGRKAQDANNPFGNAAVALGISGKTTEFGFDGLPAKTDFDIPYQDQMPVLTALWKAEIGINR